MARIRPFAAWRYAGRGSDLSSVAAPPYDVVSEENRRALISADASNVVALELPEGGLDPSERGNRYETGRATWDAWRANGTLAQDEAPAVYVLEQRFESGGREVRRRAFIVEVGLEPFDAGVIIPHERTLPKALGDRFELIKATGANFSQVLGLFDDPELHTDSLFDRVMIGAPMSVATDEDGVVSALWGSDDPAIAGELSRLLASRQIFIADGHHRYTTALAYRDLRRVEAECRHDETIDPPHDFVMMALVNMDDPDLVVLPTHRVVDAHGFDADAFVGALHKHFVVEDVKGDPVAALGAFEGPAMLVKTRDADRPFLIKLRPETDLAATLGLGRSDAWNHLDVAVLQELILLPLLGIHPDQPETLERLTFAKDAQAAFDATSEHDIAFVLRATRMDQLRDVALAGETMPQKSTYFYPKLLSGLVFRSAE